MQNLLSFFDDRKHKPKILPEEVHESLAKLNQSATPSSANLEV